MNADPSPIPATYVSPAVLREARVNAAAEAIFYLRFPGLRFNRYIDYWAIEYARAALEAIESLS